jgi:hypothetical protein
MRRARFEDWQDAARRGYVDGGLSPEAAAAIVANVADGLAPLFRGRLTEASLVTWLAALDLEALAHARRVGETIFAEGAQLK